MGRFLSTFVKTAALFLLLFGALLVFAYYQTPTKNTFSNFLNLPFTGFAIPYLVFIASWAIAYGKHIVFPNKQYVLVIGVMIGALGIATMSLGEIAIDSTPTEWKEVLVNFASLYAFGLIGAAMQLYFLVIVLRYLPFNFFR